MQPSMHHIVGNDKACGRTARPTRSSFVKTSNVGRKSRIECTLASDSLLRVGLGRLRAGAQFVGAEYAHVG